MATPKTLTELSALIHEHTTKVEAYYTTHNLPAPSFHPSTPLKTVLPSDIETSRQIVLEAMDELTALMLGPVECLIPPPNAWICVTALQRFGIAKSFPITESSTFGEIAQKCSISESDTRRIVRQAIAFYIFTEPSPGVIAHTAASKALAQLPAVGAFIDFIAGEMLPASTRLVDAMQKWPGSEEPNEAGFALSEGTDFAMMEVVTRDPKRAQCIGTAMTFLHSRPEYDVKYLLDTFPWDNAARGVLVDVGGAKGDVAVDICRALPDVKCVVLDKPEVISGAVVPDDVAGRIEFRGHDFFEKCDVRADVYLLRHVLHDWSDKYAAKILGNLVPSLRTGARICVMDMCLPAPGSVSPFRGRVARNSVLYMKGIQNAKERDEEDFRQLFESVDSRFRFDEVIKPEGSALALICVTWMGENGV
ncbi:S-adenosyl-L-methionine-dependent methyltransferase [Glarea lozoyensis ATCC 20868]|uniref:S-adenosyl-L-methionine-dependent methyltransferase n=1 Tax=Glarea lozoyensis (strain ATCC 20868 / MF5171) TaxID=1116229 RepID=S3DPD5_GLAL2|nr:S-adenosyl-L-methionine-dependent methyltransferase [Glarea lozoyensis ATCC 20868]EPE28293.1 S-adenosyl-L-methionine-dependent methyltransferase [Glarea lozoyensis ATCC 20868]